MKKVKNEVDRKQIVIQYYLARWEIPSTEVLRIQVNDKEENFSVLIETSGKHKQSVFKEPKTKSKTTKKNHPNKEKINEQIKIVKWRYLKFVLAFFIKLFYGFIHRSS